MNKQGIEQLNQAAAALIKPRKAAHKAVHGFRRELQNRRIAEYEDGGGCKKCGGRGWVVTWDTLDSMSGCYAEYGDCPNEKCTPDTRTTHGLDVTYYSKYDRNRGVQQHELWRTDQERANLVKLERAEHDAKNAWAMAAQAYEGAKEVTKGKLVEITRKPRGYSSATKGTLGVVFWTGTNQVGTDKVGLRTKDGTKVFTTLKSCEVVETKPGSEWNDLTPKETVPVIGIVKHKTTKAALIRPINVDKEIWVPFSQCSSLKTCKKKETVSFEFPMWMAKKNGLA